MIYACCSSETEELTRIKGVLDRKLGVIISGSGAVASQSEMHYFLIWVRDREYTFRGFLGEEFAGPSLAGKHFTVMAITIISQAYSLPRKPNKNCTIHNLLSCWVSFIAIGTTLVYSFENSKGLE